MTPPISWLEQDVPDPASVIEDDEAQIVCDGCPHTLAQHTALDGWWPCFQSACPCPNFTDTNDCGTCHGKRWLTDDDGAEYTCMGCAV